MAIKEDTLENARLDALREIESLQLVLKQFHLEISERYHLSRNDEMTLGARLMLVSQTVSAYAAIRRIPKEPGQ